MNYDYKGESYLFLDFYCGRDAAIVDIFIDVALHHSAAVIVFDVPFPSLLLHLALLIEALLPEVFDGIVVSIG